MAVNATFFALSIYFPQLEIKCFNMLKFRAPYRYDSDCLRPKQQNSLIQRNMEISLECLLIKNGPAVELQRPYFSKSVHLFQITGTVARGTQLRMEHNSGFLSFLVKFPLLCFVTSGRMSGDRPRGSFSVSL